MLLSMADPQEPIPARWYHKCNRARPVTDFPKPRGNCHRCREGEVRRQHERARQRLENGDVLGLVV
jgi:hypothetical protein